MCVSWCASLIQSESLIQINQGSKFTIHVHVIIQSEFRNKLNNNFKK